MKVKATSDCDWHTAMDWALMAKNTMQSVNGYRPPSVGVWTESQSALGAY